MTDATSANTRQQRHRERMRAAGFKRIEEWARESQADELRAFAAKLRGDSEKQEDGK